MFTGIVEAVGVLGASTVRDGDAHIRIDASTLDLSDVKIGDSISVSGVCLTATALTLNTFEADLSAETLARTTLGKRRVGDRVNLEKALRFGERLGGHLVSGHVDGIGHLRGRSGDERGVLLTFESPPTLARYIAQKGSICIDGVSLTVNRVDGTSFDVSVIPHTMSVTTLGAIDIEAAVNLEVDLLARYLERLLIDIPAGKQ